MGAHRKPTVSAPERVRTVARYTALTAAASLGVVVGIDNSPAHAAEVQVDAVTGALPQVNWDPIIRCESGGDPTIRNTTVPGSTASGLFQFLTSSWLAYGGGKYAPTAAQATVAQQYEIANAAYAASGLSPWTASQGCWGSHLAEILHGTSSAPASAPVKDSSTTAKHASNQAAPHAAPSTTPPKHAAPAPVTPHVVEAVDRSSLPNGDYTVKPGDTLSMLAYRNGEQGWQGVYQRNHDTVGDNPDLIFPGQHLQL
jgi:hypothetical protein